MKKIQSIKDLTPIQYDDLVNRMLCKATSDLICHIIKSSVEKLHIGDIPISALELRGMLDLILDVINNYIPDDTEKEDNGCDLADC